MTHGSAPLTRSVDDAATALLAGGLVAFPTETVYGLGALVDDGAAVARVFEVKGRPPDHPLIVHLPSIDHLDEWSHHVPEWARAVADQLWPGPLTLIVERSTRVPDLVTGGQNTVALRVPAHPIAQELLAAVGSGVAAPSANRFGGVSPTSATHVVADLAGRLDPTRDLILDGGPCGIGVESTIVVALDRQPRLLRPGAVSAEQITAITGRAVTAGGVDVRAPGTLESHYAPRARVILCGADELPDLAAAHRRGETGVIALRTVDTPQGLSRLSAPHDSESFAHGLYAALRRGDGDGLRTILVVPPTGDDAFAIAVRDRLGRASH